MYAGVTDYISRGRIAGCRVGKGPFGSQSQRSLAMLCALTGSRISRELFAFRRILEVKPRSVEERESGLPSAASFPRWLQQAVLGS